MKREPSCQILKVRSRSLRQRPNVHGHRDGACGAGGGTGVAMAIIVTSTTTCTLRLLLRRNGTTTITPQVNNADRGTSCVVEQVKETLQKVMPMGHGARHLPVLPPCVLEQCHLMHENQRTSSQTQDRVDASECLRSQKPCLRQQRTQQHRQTTTAVAPGDGGGVTVIIDWHVPEAATCPCEHRCNPSTGLG